MATKLIDNHLLNWYYNINYGLYKPLHWQKPLFKVLHAALAGRCSKILISAPPQHGKTELIINAFCSYYMVTNPDDDVIVTAYSQQRATSYGLKIRNIINEFGERTRFKPRLSQDQHSKTNFNFQHPYKGSLLAAGSHGAIMGNPANMIIIDDPIKELRDAHSQTMQEQLDEWYVGSINTRLRKNDVGREPILIVVAQRLHRKDLQGILQEKYDTIDGVKALQLLEQGGTIPKNVFVNLNFPALCVDKETDILHREVGEPLWSQHKSREDLLNDKEMMGDYRFETIMQGNPQDMADYFFTRNMFYDEDDNLTCLESIRDVQVCPIGRFWDTAARSNSPRKIEKHGDYYSGVQVGYYKPDQYFYCFNIAHGKDQALNVARTIQAKAIDDGYEKFTYIAQEPGSMSPMFLNMLDELLNGYKLYWQRETDNKAFRSIELQSVCSRGGLKFVVQDKNNPTSYELEWITMIIDELCSFDGKESDASKGKHDDIVDSLSSAVNFFYINQHLYPYY